MALKRLRRSAPGGGAEELRLDLKGVVYEARMVPSATCLIVRLEGQEAKARARARFGSRAHDVVVTAGAR